MIVSMHCSCKVLVQLDKTLQFDTRVPNRRGYWLLSTNILKEVTDPPCFFYTFFCFFLFLHGLHLRIKGDANLGHTLWVRGRTTGVAAKVSPGLARARTATHVALVASNTGQGWKLNVCSTWVSVGWAGGCEAGLGRDYFVYLENELAYKMS